MNKRVLKQDSTPLLGDKHPEWLTVNYRSCLLPDVLGLANSGGMSRVDVVADFQQVANGSLLPCAVKGVFKSDRTGS